MLWGRIIYCTTDLQICSSRTKHLVYLLTKIHQWPPIFTTSHVNIRSLYEISCSRGATTTPIGLKWSYGDGDTSTYLFDGHTAKSSLVGIFYVSRFTFDTNATNHKTSKYWNWVNNQPQKSWFSFIGFLLTIWWWYNNRRSIKINTREGTIQKHVKLGTELTILDQQQLLLIYQQVVLHQISTHKHVATIIR